MHYETDSDSVILPTYTLHSGEAPIVEEVAWLGEGDFCDCYLVNGTHVFRFAKHADASAAMAVERCLLPILQPYLPVAIPAPQFTGHADKSAEEMVGYPLIQGDPLEREVLERVSPSAYASLIAQIAEFMRRLHAVPLSAVQGCDIRTLEPLPHLTRLVEEGRTHVAPHLRAEVWHYYETLLAQYTQDPTLHTYEPALLHGDLSPDHFLADPAQATLTGVIDFGDVCIGDPAWDFIYTCEDYGTEILHAVLAQYDPANAPLLARKARLYQQMNNLDYALSALVAGELDEVDEALEILEAQATTVGG